MMSKGYVMVVTKKPNQCGKNKARMKEEKK